MTRWAIVILLGAALAAPLAASDTRGTQTRNLVPNAELTLDASGQPVGWRTWAPREALAPEAAVVDAGGGGKALRLRARHSASYGKWLALLPEITGGKTYEFEALYRASNVATEEVSVAAILSWCETGKGEVPWWPVSNGDCGGGAGTVLQRDYAERAEDRGEWSRVSRKIRAPKAATSATVELLLRWTDGGSVLWKDIRLTEVDAKPPRVVRVATTRIAIPEPTTLETNLDLMKRMLDKAGAQRPDVVLLSEGLYDRWVGPLEQTAQPIPGPLTDILGEMARKYGMYVATSLHEREGDRLYNTAVLIGRRGEVVGKYRKVHLALEEAERGLTAGTEFPVFETDFGRVGMMICWDYWFPEPARLLRLKGAEMLLLPIAGDGDPRHWDVTSRARALDNSVYLVASNTVTESGSRIIGPTGQVLAETTDDFGVAISEIDLNREHRLLWLSVGADGEARNLYIKERHPHTYEALTEGGRPPR
jgi:predicted amidohydrolase